MWSFWHKITHSQKLPMTNLAWQEMSRNAHIIRSFCKQGESVYLRYFRILPSCELHLAHRESRRSKRNCIPAWAVAKTRLHSAYTRPNYFNCQITHRCYNYFLNRQECVSIVGPISSECCPSGSEAGDIVTPWRLTCQYPEVVHDDHVKKKHTHTHTSALCDVPGFYVCIHVLVPPGHPSPNAVTHDLYCAMATATSAGLFIPIEEKNVNFDFTDRKAIIYSINLRECSISNQMHQY